MLWREAFGRLSFDADAPTANDATVFDLASLTKPIATTTLVLDLIARGQLTLDEPIAAAFAEWRGADREHVTVRDLLEHASGLTARLLEQAPEQRREFEHDICVMPLEYVPRTRSIYSDLGFLLLGFLIADRSGFDLEVHFDRVIRSLLEADRLTARLDPGALPDHLLGYRVPDRCATTPRRPTRWTKTSAAADVWSASHTTTTRRHSGRRDTPDCSARSPVSAPSRARRCGRRVAATVPAPLSPSLVGARRASIVGAGKLAGARVGHHAADIVVRDEHVRRRVRPRRLHRHVALDRSGARAILRPADQSRVRRRHRR